MDDQDARAEKLRLLSPREQEVFHLRCQGLALSEIADELVIEERTVKFHIANIYTKLGMRGLSPTARQRESWQYCQLLGSLPEPATLVPSGSQPEPSQPPGWALVAVEEDESLRISEPRTVQVRSRPIPVPPLPPPRRFNSVVLVALIAVVGGLVGAAAMAGLILLLLRPSSSVLLVAPTALPAALASTPLPVAALSPVVTAASTTVTTSRAPTPSMVVRTPTSPVSTLQPTPSPGPPPEPGTLLYVADWRNGLADWTGTQDWKTVDGMLVNDSTGRDHSIVLAPYQASTVDYALEAEVQVLNSEFGRGFWLMVRRDERGAYLGGTLNGDRVDLAAYPYSSLMSRAFSDRRQWHTYRFEVKGNMQRLSIDGALWLETADNRYLTGRQLGVDSSHAQVSVRSFRVIAL